MNWISYLERIEYQHRRGLSRKLCSELAVAGDPDLLAQVEALPDASLTTLNASAVATPYGDLRKRRH